MKFFRIDLLTLLISLFILNSCKNQDTAGFTLGTKGNLSGSLVDTATVFTKTVAEDSVVTSNMAQCPLGYFNDPIFGVTQADLITDLNLPGSAAYTLPAGIITIDSAVLILQYTHGFYGDSSATSKYVLNVYQLAQRQTDGGTYYNSSVFNHQSTLLGTKAFAPKPNTKVVIDSVVSGKASVPDTIAPEIRIPINQNFIRTSLFGASSAQLNSNLIFKNNVKGLYVALDKTQSTGIGGIMMVSGTASIAVYIRAASGTVIDTEIVSLPINQHTSYINHVRSAAFQSAITNKTSVTDSVVYLQGLAGSRVKVNFPYIDSLFSHRNVGGVNNIVINRAELVVSVNNIKATDIPAYLVPLPRLTMYELDIAHQRVSIPDASGLSDADAVGAFGGYLLATVKPANTYHFLLTSYLQNLITNKLIDYGTFIAPTDTSSTTSVAVTPTAIMAARTVAGGGYVNALGAKNSPYSMRLNVIYTKTK
jgi:hypothetical protein